MTRVIMHGCNGHMGQVITDLIAKDENAQIVAGIDMVDNRDNGYPVFTDIKACDVEADVMIDFSSLPTKKKAYGGKRKQVVRSLFRGTLYAETPLSFHEEPQIIVRKLHGFRIPRLPYFQFAWN